MPKIAQVEDRDAAADRAEKFTKVARQTNGAAADQSEKFTKVARRAIDAGADAARDAGERTQTAAAAALADRSEIALRSSKDLTESGRMLLELFAEQSRHSLEAATVFRQAVDWAGIFAAQRNFFSASLERSLRLHESYREMLQVGMKSAALPVRR